MRSVRQDTYAIVEFEPVVGLASRLVIALGCCIINSWLDGPRPRSWKQGTVKAWGLSWHRNDPELLQQGKLVEVGPGLHDLAVCQPMDVHLSKRHGAARGRDALQF